MAIEMEQLVETANNLSKVCMYVDIYMFRGGVAHLNLGAGAPEAVCFDSQGAFSSCHNDM